MKGRAGAWFRQPSTISEAPEGTLESLIVAAGIENGLIPLRVDGKDAEWLRTPIYSRPLGYSWMKAAWPNHFDAMIFNSKMDPSSHH
jgi:erythromycin esterase-like protein